GCVKSSTSRYRRALAELFDKAGHGIAWLSALAQPIFRPVEIHFHVVGLLARLVSADFLDELPITRAPAISHDNAEHRGVLGPDPLEANFNCHKNKVECGGGNHGFHPPTRKRLPEKGGQSIVLLPRLGKGSFQEK